MSEKKKDPVYAKRMSYIIKMMVGMLVLLPTAFIDWYELFTDGWFGRLLMNIIPNRYSYGASYLVGEKPVILIGTLLIAIFSNLVANQIRLKWLSRLIRIVGSLPAVGFIGSILLSLFTKRISEYWDFFGPPYWLTPWNLAVYTMQFSVVLIALFVTINLVGLFRFEKEISQSLIVKSNVDSTKGKGTKNDKVDDELDEATLLAIAAEEARQNISS